MNIEKMDSIWTNLQKSDIQYAAGHSSVNTTRHYDRSKTSGPSLEMVEKAIGQVTQGHSNKNAQNLEFWGDKEERVMGIEPRHPTKKH